MAVKQLFIVIAIVAAIFPIFVSATDFIVGDSQGWRNGYNYTEWVMGKEFHVGDKLVFNYPVGEHNVFKVNATSFKDCIIPPKNESLTSGKDEVVLAQPGKKWYICGVKTHCKDGNQKLVINVADSAPAPAPNSAPGIVKSGYQVLLGATIATAMIVMA